MSDIVYPQEPYTEVKDRYLHYLSEGKILKSQVAGTSPILKAALVFEKNNQKDLYAFSRSQVQEFLFSLAPTTPKVSRQNYYVVRRYIEWAINEGLHKDINSIAYVDKNWLDRFISTTPQNIEKDVLK
jgi:hypothetical protein